MPAQALHIASPRRFAPDKLGVLIGALGTVALILPFTLFRANRIVLGESRSIAESLPQWHAILLYAAVGAALLVGLLRLKRALRLLISFVLLAVLLLSLGQAASFLTPSGNTYARVSPGAGFWLLVFAFALMATDALARLKPAPVVRILILAGVIAAFALMLWSGTFRNLSILREYNTRAGTFWAEAQIHLWLAFGSVALASVIGIPLGIVCHRVRPLRSAVLGVLNIVQTIPSIALFGLLIAPLAWVAANVPGAAAIGISGIGFAPAMVALIAYSLLPVVANTVVGLAGVPEAAADAARGMGMTVPQRLLSVELPLAFPVILTGIRIVLVQNIGLATIAALIGGGGFGVFVFQGIGQTAMDLVLLGAVPTVGLAFAAAIIMDAVVELARGRRTA